jgi:hypothetical protein
MKMMMIILLLFHPRTGHKGPQGVDVDVVVVAAVVVVIIIIIIIIMLQTKTYKKEHPIDNICF